MSGQVIPPFETDQFEPLRTTPAELIGPNGKVQEFSVRNFKHDERWGDGDFTKLSNAIHAFCSPVSTYVDVITRQRYGKEVESLMPHSFGSIITRVLQNKLIDPKVKTGSITQLHILMVDPQRDPTVLPAAMTARFLASHITPRQTLEYMPGYETLFRIFGKVKMGSYLAPIACGVCVTPYIDSAHIGTKHSYSDKPYVRAAVQLEKYTKKGTTADAAGWDAIIEQSRRREAIARLNPLSGGLVNPH